MTRSCGSISAVCSTVVKSWLSIVNGSSGSPSVELRKRIGMRYESQDWRAISAKQLAARSCPPSASSGPLSHLLTLKLLPFICITCRSETCSSKPRLWHFWFKPLKTSRSTAFSAWYPMRENCVRKHIDINIRETVHQPTVIRCQYVEDDFLIFIRTTNGSRLSVQRCKTLWKILMHCRDITWRRCGHRAVGCWISWNRQLENFDYWLVNGKKTPDLPVLLFRKTSVRNY